MPSREACSCRSAQVRLFVARTTTGAGRDDEALALLADRVVDVLELDLQDLRSAVGVVTQRTEILAGTLRENITLFADRPPADVRARAE